MVLYSSDIYYPSPVERAPTDSTPTGSLLSFGSDLSVNGPSNVGPSVTRSLLPPIPLTSSGSNLSSSTELPSSAISTRSPSSSSSTGSRSNTISNRSQSNTSSTGSRSISSETSTSVTGSRSSTKTSSIFQVLTSSQPFPSPTEALPSGTTSGPMVTQSSLYPSEVGNGYLQQTVTPSLSINIEPSPSISLTSSNLSPLSSTHSGSTAVSAGSSSSTLTSSSSSSSTTISPISSTSSITSISSLPYSFSSSHAAFTFSSSTLSISTITPSPSTFFVSTTEVDSTTVVTTPGISTLLLTSLLNSGTTTWTTTTSGVLSTVGVGNAVNGLSRSPGAVAGLALGILGAFAFGVLWLFCARRRHRQLMRDASAIPAYATGGPLEAEVDMEEPYAGILAAIHAGMGAGRNAPIEGDTSGDVSGEFAMTHPSSPTLPLNSLSGDGHNEHLYAFPLSPPPSGYLPVPPPSAYVPSASSKGQRRNSSPGPDASAWFAGYNMGSSASHHSHSTSNILTRTETGTRTRTGSEEPLLTRVGSGSSYLDSTNKIRLGSAFGSPRDSVNERNFSPTSLGRRSNTISSFGALRSISSRGAMRSTSSHGYEFGFGSASSGTGSHRGPALGLAISGVPNSYNSRRAIKWKKGKRESTGSSTSVTSACASDSVDERPVGVRAFLGRLRLRNTPSPKAYSLRDLESEGTHEKRNSDDPGPRTSPRTFSPVISPATPPPEPVSTPIFPRFILSNPDPQPHSPYVNMDAGGAVQEHEDGLRPPTWPWLGHAQTNMQPPSPAPTLGSRITTAEGLLDPRLCENAEGRSNASLRDFEDYSRPIGGLVNNRMLSTTTFGTVDSQDGASVRNQEHDQQEDATVPQTPRASWIIDGGPANFHAD